MLSSCRNVTAERAVIKVQWQVMNESNVKPLFAEVMHVKVIVLLLNGNFQHGIEFIISA